MLISCKFENGRIRSFNLDYCVEIMIDDKRIELELLRGKDCSTIVITPEIITNFNEVSDKILDFIYD
ncbi:hypothetical protein IX317_001114 [Fusobacterium sp. DD29]|uniref:hypothetical protein n=1 Tax=unclassified Fusobacterium TaxID=2648384 RepID=UPI001B8D95D9|nr:MULTISPECIES: hypothetical protein [unclassified Fusobacterium]MBR8701312.1 hypothetical protein [Fusobacterium sp. DD45]MBR8711072.1 hypothetical protein [Fusobacterium sp. DD28]MBR8749440.1 hypothetical protein [Fusobacterium sp. DD29]MBR8751646.1 hypothetical protein [Fusobacterium sp. DD26]MBR8761670.1 hypothetical protein [Fusobacterium sp. DD25]